MIAGTPLGNDRRAIHMETPSGPVRVCKRDVVNADLPGHAAHGVGGVLTVFGLVAVGAQLASDDDAQSGDNNTACGGCAPVALLATGVVLFLAGHAQWSAADDALGLDSPPHPPCDPEAP